MFNLYTLFGAKVRSAKDAMRIVASETLQAL